MNKQEKLAESLLKLASVAGLRGIVDNEHNSLELRKEASDRFNYISTLGRADMDEELIKVAFEIYDDAQLNEVLAGYHTEELFEKTASIRMFAQCDSDTLEKLASGDAVAAKGVGNALTDAAEHIEEAIEEAKVEAESHPGGSLTPAEALGNTTEGYNPISNPEDYDIQKSAMEEVEDALMVKEAAESSYEAAMYVLQHYGLA